jgi:hypothetical protein
MHPFYVPGSDPDNISANARPLLGTAAYSSRYSGTILGVPGWSQKHHRPSLLNST